MSTLPLSRLAAVLPDVLLLESSPDSIIDAAIKEIADLRLVQSKIALGLRSLTDLPGDDDKPDPLVVLETVQRAFDAERDRRIAAERERDEAQASAADETRISQAGAEASVALAALRAEISDARKTLEAYGFRAYMHPPRIAGAAPAPEPLASTVARAFAALAKAPMMDRPRWHDEGDRVVLRVTREVVIAVYSKLTNGGRHHWSTQDGGCDANGSAKTTGEAERIIKAILGLGEVHRAD